MKNSKVDFCHCGRVLKDKVCPRHKEKVKKKPREKIPKYSGRSSRPYGAYELF